MWSAGAGAECESGARAESGDVRGIEGIAWMTHAHVGERHREGGRERERGGDREGEGEGEGERDREEEEKGKEKGKLSMEKGVLWSQLS